jgi:hypothetical protein
MSFTGDRPVMGECGLHDEEDQSMHLSLVGPSTLSRPGIPVLGRVDLPEGHSLRLTTHKDFGCEGYTPTDH